MAGHSKWANIQHRKGINDSKKGKIFTRHAKLIYIAARDGGIEPDKNPTLRAAILNAKQDNVPNANIEKALSKAAGGDKEENRMEEIMYEAFGPAGTTFYIHSITDNRNRVVANLKTILAKNGGHLGEAGTVGWMYEKKGQIEFQSGNLSKEQTEMLIIESNAEDFVTDEKGFFVVFTNPTDLNNVKVFLENRGLNIDRAELVFKAKNSIQITDAEVIKNLDKLKEAIEEEDDTANVYYNFFT